MSQKRKVTLYFNSAMLVDTQREALRQDRSISWIVQAAWRIARDELKRMPSAITSLGTGSADPVQTPLPSQAAPPPFLPRTQA